MGPRTIFIEYLKLRLYFIAVLFLTIGAPTFAADYFTEKPDFVESCTINDPEFVKCSTRSIQKLLDTAFAEKSPELKQVVGQLSPLKLDTLNFKQDGNEAATLEAQLNNMLVTGLGDMIIQESRVSKKDYSWETKVLIPKMRIEGKYTLKGRILLLPLSGNGDFWINLDKLDVDMHTKTRLIQKGPFTFYNITDLRVDLGIGKMQCNFGNLFNGRSKEVEESTNEFFNTHWREFVEALRPLITETVERVLKRIISRIFLYTPANFLVTDIPTPDELYNKQKKTAT